MAESRFKRFSLRWAFSIAMLVMSALVVSACFYSSASLITLDARFEPTWSAEVPLPETHGSLGASSKDITGYYTTTICAPYGAQTLFVSNLSGAHTAPAREEHVEDMVGEEPINKPTDSARFDITSAIGLLMQFRFLICSGVIVSSVSVALWIVRARSVGSSAREACQLLIAAALVSLPFPLWLVFNDLIEPTGAAFRGLRVALGIPAIVYALVVVATAIGVRLMTPPPAEKIRLHFGNIAAFYLFMPIAYMLTLRFGLMFGHLARIS
ncbi:hypothetical protein Corgl_0938 [Coriobacterium glomerans PW2]|uniref:Uncharacterized protein n=1 Tax=Coriobacterium glomerans (strain ATCC 49209 / DSM 20642 / JCM 10262 / PW2) TaxID=700015 RepID=F2N9L8_CORGP|nr:hypothetical protein [Coriobacterium glomerans]AEB07047.1 hypothetical protein Corgl_0938 [Coriobacterium glomerans PW2]